MKSLSDDALIAWSEWIARNRLQGTSDDALAEVMVQRGFSPAHASALVTDVVNSPVFKAAAPLARRARNLQGMNDVRLALLAQSDVMRSVPRCSGLSTDEFFERYYYANRPVVLVDQMHDWPAMRKWSPDFFRDTWGDLPIEIQSCRRSEPIYEVFLKGHTAATTMGTFVEQITSVDSTNEFYLTANDRLLERPGVEGLLKDFWPFPGLFEPRQRAGSQFFWFGPKGAVSPLHRDRLNVMMTQVYGRKRVRLIPSEALHRVYNFESFFSEVDCEEPDLQRFPDFGQVPYVDVELGPGEALLIPVGWWHHVRSLEISINISFTNFARTNDYDVLLGLFH